MLQSKRSTIPLKFGIELELLLQLPTPSELDLHTTNDRIQHFSEIMKTTLSHIPITFSPQKHITDYSTWIVTEDTSLSGDNYDCLALELISPIIYDVGTQLLELDEILSFFQLFDVHVNSTCGFHLHISQKEKPFSLNELKQISKMFIILEPILDSANKERISNVYCQSNCNNIYFKDLSVPTIINRIDHANTTKELVYVMNPLDSEHELMGEFTKKELYFYSEYNRLQRFYKMNLTNLLNHKQTIEIRSHRGTTNIHDILKWIEMWCFIIHFSKLFPTENNL